MKRNLDNPFDLERRPIPAKDMTHGTPKKAETIETSKLALRVWECIRRGLIARTKKEAFE